VCNHIFPYTLIHGHIRIYGLIPLHYRLPSATLPCELKGKVTLSDCHLCKSTNWWTEFQHPTRHLSMASKSLSHLPQLGPPKCITNFARLWSPSSHDLSLLLYLHTRTILISRSASLSLLDHSPQVNLHPHSITTSKYISKPPWSRPPSVSPYMLEDGLQAHLQAHSITASKCTTKLAHLRSHSSPDVVLQVPLEIRTILISDWISKLTQWQPPRVCPLTINYRLQVHFWTGLLMRSKWISKDARLLPPSVSPTWLGVYCWIHLVAIFRRTTNCSHAPPAASADVLCVDG